MERHGVELDIAAYLDEGSSALSSEAQLHLGRCESCQALLAAHRRVAEQLRSAPRMRAPSTLTLESVLARLPETPDHQEIAEVLAQLPAWSAPADLQPPLWHLLDRPSRKSVLGSVRSRFRSSRPRVLLAAAGLVVAAGLALRLLPGLAGSRPSDAPVIHVTIVNCSPLDPALSADSKERLLAQVPSLGAARSAQ